MPIIPPKVDRVVVQFDGDGGVSETTVRRVGSLAPSGTPSTIEYASGHAQDVHHVDEITVRTYDVGGTWRPSMLTYASDRTTLSLLVYHPTGSHIEIHDMQVVGVRPVLPTETEAAHEQIVLRRSHREPMLLAEIP